MIDRSDVPPVAAGEIGQPVRERDGRAVDARRRVKSQSPDLRRGRSLDRHEVARHAYTWLVEP